MSSKGGGGRHKDSIWCHYNEMCEDNITFHRCKYCTSKVSSRVQRLKQHLNKCKKYKAHAKFDKQWSGSNTSGSSYDSEANLSAVSHSMKQKKRKRVIEKNVDAAIVLSAVNDPSTSQSIEDQEQEIQIGQAEPIRNKSKNKNTVLSQRSIVDFSVKTSVKDKNKLDVLVSKFMYGCNIPFSVVESEHFINMIHSLRPGYDPPSRKRIAGELLQKVNEELLTNAKNKLDGKTVTLIQDGWSSIHNDPVIANCISTGHESYFLSSVDTTTNKKTADYCLQLAVKAKEEAESLFNCKVRSFVSDNEAKMCKMRKDLEKEYQEEYFISYGCASHYINLAGQEISKKTTDVFKHVVEVQKYFRNHHKPAALLKSYQGSVKPQIPCETRWNSQKNCLETFLTNREFYLKIVDLHEQDIDNNIVNIINNIGLYKEVRNLIKQLEPLSIALDKLQSDSASISDVVYEWLELLDNSDLKPHLEILQNRYKEATTNAHVLAYMLDIRYRGHNLEEPRKEEARLWLSQININFLPLLLAFEAEDSPFPKSYFQQHVLKTTSPSIWWKSIKKCNEVDKKFLDFVCHLMVCTASSASIERIFSNFGFIINKLRNRLGLEKASKLVMNYKLLNLEKSNKGCSFDW